MSTADPCKAYRQSAIHSESKADIFIQLYDQVSSHLHSAALAVEARDIPKKGAELSRALTILVHLQGALDLERGGEVALTLNQFYKLVRKEIFEGSVKLDAAVLRQAAAHVMEVRNIWDQAQALSLSQTPATPVPSPSLAGPNVSPPANSPSQDEIPQFRGWNA
jgi:flagellar secretion chaperone FliS